MIIPDNDVPSTTSARQLPKSADIQNTSQADKELRDFLQALVPATSDQLHEETASRVHSYARIFNGTARVHSDLSVFVFHAPFPAEEVTFRDTTITPSIWDYREIAKVFRESIFRWHPDATIFWVTVGTPGVRVAPRATSEFKITLPLNVRRGMYERVNAMLAYVMSDAFVAPTLFLDSDAFLNCNANAHLRDDFDVGITRVDELGKMPINEGVIMARAIRPQAVRSFFTRYLATYDCISSLDITKAYYGDVSRWRGGQLALSTLAAGVVGYGDHVMRTGTGPFILRILDGDIFNYRFPYDKPLRRIDIVDKAIVHLKGDRKVCLRHIANILKTTTNNSHPL